LRAAGASLYLLQAVPCHTSAKLSGRARTLRQTEAFSNLRRTPVCLACRTGSAWNTLCPWARWEGYLPAVSYAENSIAYSCIFTRLLPERQAREAGMTDTTLHGSVFGGDTPSNLNFNPIPAFASIMAKTCAGEARSATFPDERCLERARHFF
jgi:hypothetical protein